MKQLKLYELFLPVIARNVVTNLPPEKAWNRLRNPTCGFKKRDKKPG
jgi:hypothetical protein